MDVGLIVKLDKFNSINNACLIKTVSLNTDSTHILSFMPGSGKVLHKVPVLQSANRFCLFSMLYYILFRQDFLTSRMPNVLASIFRFRFFFFLFILALFSGVALSQNTDFLWNGDTLRIDEVVIQSQRPLSETGIVKTSIDSLLMEEKSARSLSEMLSEHSPVFIKSYGRGSLATASFRGTAPSHTKVTWNGMDINSPMLGMVDFSLIPVYFADEISLYHGAGSMQETSGALGGLISLNTKPNWSEKFSGGFLQGIGSYGTRDSYLKIHAGTSRFQSGTRAFYSHSDNDFSYLNRDIIDSVDLETGRKYHPLTKNKNAGYTQYGFLQEFFILPGDKDMLKFSFWGQKGERSIPFLSANESGSSGGSNHQEDDVLRITSVWKHYAGDMSFQYISGLNVQDLRYRFMNETGGLGLISLINSSSRSSSFLNRAEIEYKNRNTDVFKVKFGYINDNVDSYESVSQTGYNQQRGNASVMLNWSRQSGERIRTGVHIGEEVSGQKWSPLLFNISGEYHFLDRERLYFRTGVARNVKFPGMNDLYYQPGGNPDLSMETSFSREVGIKWKTIFESLSLNLSLDGYHSDVKNWILWLPSFNGYWEPRNIEKVEISGLEFSSLLSGTSGKYSYEAHVGYAFTRSQNQSAPLSNADLSTGKQLPFIPEHSANTTFHASRDGWSLTWIWNYFSERFINTSNNYHSTRDYLYPYFMNQLSTGKRFASDRFTGDLSLSIHNVFNEEYRSILQRPMPGRNISMIMKIRF